MTALPGKRVAFVGGGPSGMTAALRAYRDVSVAEFRASKGGHDHQRRALASADVRERR